jgi:ABC-type enterochelin transport system permease subunit
MTTLALDDRRFIPFGLLIIVVLASMLIIVVGRLPLIQPQLMA